jgi:hypothetical protein
VGELQERGVVHYHVLIVFRGRCPIPDKPFKLRTRKRFAALWEYGMSNTVFDVRHPFYVCKYVGKEYQKDFEKFPRGAHAWAVWFSDHALKLGLRYQSLSELEQGLVNAFGWSHYRDGLGDLKAELNKEGWQFSGAFVQKDFAKFMAGGE